VKSFVSAVSSVSRWTVRARTAVAATFVVTLCLVLAGGALLLVLFSSLESSARSTADARARQVADQLQTEPPGDLDRSMLATDSQVGVVQVVDGGGELVAQSAGSPGSPLAARALAPGTSEFLGRIVIGSDHDLWVTGIGAEAPTGPVTVFVGADREPVEKVVTTVAALLAVAGPIVVALVAFGTYRLVGVALQPVERIRRRVSSVTSTGLDERIPVPAADDEVARLAVTMNNMLDRLESGQAAQRRFISDASHELRSPLATITAALDLAQARPEFLDDALVESLVPEAQRMARLVGDLLLLARADERSQVQHDVEVDVDDIVYAEANRVRAITDLRVSATVNAVRVVGDPRALSRLVRNLVDNAIRHAHQTIGLECGRVDRRARIVVSDDGPGIVGEDRGRVFDRFVRLDTPRTRETGGAGLGLSIVAQIIGAHDGSISIDETPGGGARFVVVLPLAVDDPIADATDGLDAVAGER
jgi:signal transduction histidine kinase